MTKRIDTIIIGGGQAGLSTSYYLKDQGRDHIILEKANQAAQVWRNRWDSFTLITPNWMVRLPGSPYKNINPDGFMKRNEIVAYFESYIKQFKLPIRYGIQVTSVEPMGSGYCVSTDKGEYMSDNVIVAVGLYQRPKMPHFNKQLAPDILQIHSSEYKNPKSLPNGAVLVVGSAQSGSQIAEELYQNGRKVYLSVSGAGRVPRRYRGVDVTHWMEKMGYYKRTVDELESPKDKFGSSAHGTGKNGGHTINLHQFTKDGVVLLGRIEDVEEDCIFLSSDLNNNLAKADQFEINFVNEVDNFIKKNELDFPAETLPKLKDGYEVKEIRELNLNQSGIRSVIWATGYKFDFSWVKLPAFDEDGYPIQTRGVSEFAGLYFIGLPFLYSGISGVLAGVGADAAYIASVIDKSGHKRLIT